MISRALGKVSFDGNWMTVGLERDPFGSMQVRARLDVSKLHPCTEKATDATIFELLDLCIAYYVLDRSVLRPRDGWARNFTIRLPVARVDLWRESRELVEEWLFALTGDIVEVVPAIRDDQASHHSRHPVMNLDDDVDAVGLLSDGLDSLCGVDANVSQTRRMALASVITSGARDARIQKVLALVRKQAGHIEHYSISTKLFQQRKVKEKTQRSRTVLAVVTGMTVAAVLNARIVEVYENGHGLLNLPMPDLQYGSMSSQVLQPAHLPLWDSLSRALFERTIELTYPNRFRTKAEMLATLSTDARILIDVTFSCDSEYRKKGAGVLHCGMCGSCRIRQLAVRAAGLTNMDALYAGQKMAKGPDPLSCLQYHAELLSEAISSADPWNALTLLQPELVRVPYSDDARQAGKDDRTAAQERLRRDTLMLLQRHIAEIGTWGDRLVDAA